mgnify:CR=1 FL=1
MHDLRAASGGALRVKLPVDLSHQNTVQAGVRLEPEVLEFVEPLPSALRARAMTCGERRGFIEKEQLGVRPVTEDLPPSPLEL